MDRTVNMVWMLCIEDMIMWNFLAITCWHVDNLNNLLSSYCCLCFGPSRYDASAWDDASSHAPSSHAPTNASTYAPSDDAAKKITEHKTLHFTVPHTHMITHTQWNKTKKMQPSFLSCRLHLLLRMCVYYTNSSLVHRCSHCPVFTVTVGRPGSTRVRLRLCTP